MNPNGQFSPTAPVSSAPAATVDWGRTDYATAVRLQAAAVAQRNAGEIGDTLVFTEHEPVYTLGVRKGAEQNLLWNEIELQQRGIALHHASRGGDITYHGPGQIVGYPVVNLATRKDLHAYLRFLEQVMIDGVAPFGLQAERNPGKTGIWIGSRKIAAIGVAVKKWTTYHGFALNVNIDLAPYAGIVPCGIRVADGTVTSMQFELGRAQDLGEVKSALAQQFWRSWPEFLRGA